MRASTLLNDLWMGTMDLVFAPVCVACHEPIPTADSQRVVCRLCWLKCRPLPAPRCARCWSPVPTDRDPRPGCRTCEEWPAAVRARVKTINKNGAYKALKKAGAI